MFLDSNKSDKHYWLINQDKNIKMYHYYFSFLWPIMYALTFGLSALLLPFLGYTDKYFVAASYLPYHVLPLYFLHWRLTIKGVCSLIIFPSNKSNIDFIFSNSVRGTSLKILSTSTCLNLLCRFQWSLFYKVYTNSYSCGFFYFF